MRSTLERSKPKLPTLDSFSWSPTTSLGRITRDGSPTCRVSHPRSVRPEGSRSFWGEESEELSFCRACFEDKLKKTKQRRKLASQENKDQFSWFVFFLFLFCGSFLFVVAFLVEQKAFGKRKHVSQVRFFPRGIVLFTYLMLFS